MTNKDYDWIDDVVCNIMIEDGPDRHCDGHDFITDFIMALKEGKEDEWVKQYEKRIEQKQKERAEWNKRYMD